VQRQRRGARKQGVLAARICGCPLRMRRAEAAR
jgi:hypothetical protein